MSNENVKISVLINSRVEGNENCKLLEMLDSVRDNSADINAVEVLLKFDNDDHLAHAMALAISDKYPFVSDILTGPRGRGYIDIHHGYNHLLEGVAPSSRVIGAMADDFHVEKGWDTTILEIDQMKPTHAPYIVHQRPWPEMTMYPSVYKQMGDLYVIDEAPFWSRGLLELVNYPAGPFPVSFTDAWTLALEMELVERGLHISYFTDRIYINRIVHPVIDQPAGERWNTDRKTNFEFIASEEFRKIVNEQARRVSNAFTQV